MANEPFKRAAQFQRGDVVQVRYSSPKLIEEWMSGLRKVGPGDVGVVKFDPELQPYLGRVGEHGEYAPVSGVVTVTFPMIGTFGMHTSNLVLLQKAVGDDIQTG